MNDNGIQDPEDPGIPGVVVNLTCAGPDGDLGTSDDLVDSQITDDNGNYLFTEVPVGLCLAEVGVNTAPDGKTAGQCPTMFLVDLQPGQPRYCRRQLRRWSTSA